MDGLYLSTWFKIEYSRFLDLWDFLQNEIDGMDWLYLHILLKKRVPEVSGLVRFSPEGVRGH